MDSRKIRLHIEENLPPEQLRRANLRLSPRALQMRSQVEMNLALQPGKYVADKPCIDECTDSDFRDLIEQYEDRYDLTDEQRTSARKLLGEALERKARCDTSRAASRPAVSGGPPGVPTAPSSPYPVAEIFIEMRDKIDGALTDGQRARFKIKEAARLAREQTQRMGMGRPGAPRPQPIFDEPSGELR